jgi:CRP/FNR family cyclic AMP-dependent transcriptional regulator
MKSPRLGRQGELPEHKSMKQETAGAAVLAMCSQFETVSLRPGEFLFREGDQAEALYVVKRGILRIIIGSTVYEVLRPGEIVGEMAIVDGRPRSASVIAGTHAELFEIDGRRFLSLVSEEPEFSLAVMRVMARRLRMMNQRDRSGPTGLATRQRVDHSHPSQAG